jgi:ABC-type polysaccharide/polyol phosphate transport system ATPase subunit
VTDAITLDQVAKRYRVTNDGGLLVKRLMRLGRTRFRDIWALKDVSFACPEGGTLGVIGRNGSGKTTLLQLLAGVTAPTSGRVRVEGTVAPLIGVGVGFNPELTGRENVFANGQILGMSKSRLHREFDEIVAFSELEQFLDVPVKFYSSGMFLRLAFAVAIQVRPEVLLVDEILAVGDLGFQAKCIDRVAALKADGTTVVVVTHNMPTLHRMCERTIVLNKGQVAFDGSTEGAISAYHDLLHLEEGERNVAGVIAVEGGRSVPVVGGARLRCEVVGPDGEPTRHASGGGLLRVAVLVEFEREVRAPVFGLAVELDGVGAIYMSNVLPGDYGGQHGPDQPLRVLVTLDNKLLAGTYQVTGVVLDESGANEMGRSKPERFEVTSWSAAWGIVDLDAFFTIDGNDYKPKALRLTQRQAVNSVDAPRRGVEQSTDLG